MATAEVAAPSDILGPQQEQVNLQADTDKVADPSQLPFDPVKLKEKYLAERDKRLKHGQAKGGINQYKYADGHLSSYLTDPWVKPGFTRDPVDEEVECIIVGGGYAAQLVAVRLIESGIKNIRLVEKAGDFGGTWYWNRYPGAQCDIESYIYMPLVEELGFMPTEKYARAKELLAHSEMIGKKWGLYERTLFQTEVHSLQWDDATSLWTAKTSRGDKIRARFVVPAAGPLHRPKLPGLPGIESFKGHSFHSSRWDYNYTGGDAQGGTTAEGAKLTGLADKRVGIIGTGATAVQIVPHLGKWAKQVYVFQRTPSSIDVRANRPTDSAWAESLKHGWQKERMDNFDSIVNGGIEKQDLVGDGWTEILGMLLARRKLDETDPERAMAERQLADFEKMEKVRARCDEVVKDPETAASLKPWYNQMCKRPCFHDEYLQTFNRPNVKLVDTKGVGVQAITEKGIVANDEEFEVDCIIYATGFELSTDWTHRTRMEVIGRNGLTVSDAWKNGARTMHGWTTRDFPNCFFVQIVQAALTPNFIHVTSEQARHLAYVISTCKARGIQTVEPTAEAEKAWVNTIVELAKLRTPFLKECTPGYYNNEGSLSNSGLNGTNASYGGGSPAFLKILEGWRAKGDLEGLELKYKA